MKVRSAAQYKRAFQAIAERITAMQYRLLRIHYSAPDHTITVEKLAEEVRRRRIYGTYGKLGHLLCRTLKVKPTMFEGGKPVYTQVLADVPSERPEGSLVWTMRPQVVQALEELGWADSVGRGGRPAPRRSTFLLNWNPKYWDWNDDNENISDDAKATANGRKVRSNWTCGHTGLIRPGDRVFLMRLGVEPRGIIASGHATSEPFEGDHFDKERRKAGEKARYVSVAFDRILDPSVHPILPREELKRGRLADMHWDTQSSGISMPERVAKELEARWARLIRKIDPDREKALCPPGVLPDDDAEKMVQRTARGQRFLANAVVRRAIETYAMEKAIAYLKQKRYDVKDVSSKLPCDLHCRKGRQELYVEVKGTQGGGEQVQLTAGEVRFARRHAGRMALFILHSVVVRGTIDAPIVSGGKRVIRHPWTVDRKDLTPTAYMYEVPAARRRS